MSFVEHITRTGGAQYLTRYNILKTRWLKVYLHRFHAPDGACLHDHPWAWWATLVLWGGYTEGIQIRSGPSWKSWGRVRRRAGSLAFHGRRHAHRIERLHPTRQTWTLLVVGPHVRRWGFYTRRGWIPVQEYDEGRDC